ncbi:DUF484 family protein [Wenzhouxiangella sp. AB-CW3]|uniref:DUF484 family protein n=1 Tax=Wenzhouxiangella sp. AB-CW3 TaxID=2771012 RepID=UPI00168C0F38|nr:DUF484 family protein [Wenzhouxiangella sp. AB-CW3]QOC23646.1 DUF484 family protein [Wenzhouxiangella sp. AB-CW3]
MGDMNSPEERDILEWLSDHPDLFRRHPELLDRMTLPHDAGADSLIELQVRRLREDNRQLRAQLHTLAGIAGENERLMQRLHQLTLEVMTTADPREFFERLMARLGEDFKAASVRLHLLSQQPGLDGTEAIIIHEQAPPAWFGEVLERGKIVFGRLTRAKLQVLFPDCDSTVASAALVPIKHNGLLAIGADSPGRFDPDMGTLFLELLGTTIRHRLEQIGTDQRKRA